MRLLPILLPLFLAPALIIAKVMPYKNWEAQLYEDLLFDYNKIPRPVKNASDILMVEVGASLIRIIDVDEKNQVLTTNLWLEMRWTDSKLKWDPERYGGIQILHIPSTELWVPDFVLYNNAAGDPDITIFTDALVSSDGQVYWQPPAIYKSFCSIDVTYFPYDIQNCSMKFGAWSYTGFYVDLRQLPHEKVILKNDTDGSEIQWMEEGMDLSFFYKSAEWDLLELTSARHSVLYASCCGPEKYVDITYYFLLRRKTLFFTCNLIIPCFLISFLTTFVFYLSDHKITFCISILVTLTVFFLVLIDIMPPTSLVIPMFGRYLITTMSLVALSTMVSVVTVNFRFRSGAAHRMSPWIRILFLKYLPRVLMMKRPELPARVQLEKSPTYPRNIASTLLVDPRTITSFELNSSSAGGSPSKVATLPSTSKAKRVTSFPFASPAGKMPTPTALLAECSTDQPATISYYRYPTPSTDIIAGGGGGEAPPAYEMHRVGPTNSSMPRAQRQQRWQRAHGLQPRPLSNKNNNNVVAETSFQRSPAPVPASNQRPQAAHRIEVGKRTKHQINDIILANLLKQVRFIAEHFKRNEEEAGVGYGGDIIDSSTHPIQISDDWTFVGMVLDRLFLIIFSFLNMGTFMILIEAPSLYDSRQPLNVTIPTKPLGQANLFNIYSGRK